MVEIRDLAQLTVKELWQAVKEEEGWWGDLKPETARLVKSPSPRWYTALMSSISICRMTVSGFLLGA